MAASTSEASDPSQYDLTHHVSPYLDAHLVFPLLEFLEENTSYDAGAVQRARLELLAPTNMGDYAIEIREELGANHPSHCAGAPTVEELTPHRDRALNKLDKLEEDHKEMNELLADEDAMDALKRAGEFNAATFESKHGITAEAWATRGRGADEYFSTASRRRRGARSAREEARRRRRGRGADRPRREAPPPRPLRGSSAVARPTDAARRSRMLDNRHLTANPRRRGPPPQRS